MSVVYGSDEWLEEQRLKRLEKKAKKKKKTEKVIQKEIKKVEEKVEKVKQKMIPKPRVKIIELRAIQEAEIVDAAINLQMLTLQKFPTLINKCNDLRSLSSALNAINGTLDRLEKKNEGNKDEMAKSFYDEVVEKVMALKPKK